jgi:hypothetical protein
MKQSNINKLGILIFLLFFVSISWAHYGGHFHLANSRMLTSWQLKNGKMVQGNFSMSKNNTLVIEQENGQLIELPLDQLAPTSLSLAKVKIKQIEHLQGGQAFTAPGKTPIDFLLMAFKPYAASLTTKWDDQYFYVASNGIPNHPMMIGIKSWQQQVPLPQAYSGNNAWSIPLQPVFATTPMSTKNNFMKGAIAIAVNGIPIFNPLNNRGEDAFLVGELDQWGGHCGRADDYHYHIAPLQLNRGNNAMPIAFALDGFPVYGINEPDGTPMQPLDFCHGHQLGTAMYHYHGTTAYPYLIAAMRGNVQSDPNTPAPENQIIPQAFTSPVRPPGRPLRGATITALDSIGINTYLLKYQLGNKEGSLQYQWDQQQENFHFIYTNPDGSSNTADYQKRKKR